MLRPGRPGVLLHIPCLEALHFANLTARPQKSWVLPSLVPARGPAPPTPSRRESERSELAAYLLCMDANGSCLQCISIGALQTAGRPTLPPPGAKGLPSEATEPRRQAGNCASWAQKALLELLFLSESRSAGDRRELRLEAGTALVQSGWERCAQLLVASLPGWLRRRLRTRPRVAAAKAPAASGA